MLAHGGSFGHFVLGECVEEGGGHNDLEDRCEDEGQHAEDEAVHVLLHGERHGT